MGSYNFEVVDLGSVPYLEALKLQRAVHRAKIRGLSSDILLLLEHPHVVTLGRQADDRNILVPLDTLQRNGIQCVRVERGGDVTYHGPGQLIGYTIFDISGLGMGVIDFIGVLEECMIRVLESYGVSAARNTVNRGVWVKEGKIGFVGLACISGITMHGLALNVDVDLSYYNMIHSCGLKGVPVLSLTGILERHVPLEEVKGKTVAAIEYVLGLQSEVLKPKELLDLLRSYLGDETPSLP